MNSTATFVKLPPPSDDLPEEFLAIIQEAQRQSNRRALRLKKAAEKAGVGESTLWRDVKNGTFVPPIQINPRSVAWLEAEVDALLKAKTLISRTGKKIDLQKFVKALTAVTN